jgi:hypothetical protein
MFHDLCAVQITSQEKKAVVLFIFILTREIYITFTIYNQESVELLAMPIFSLLLGT